MWGNPHHAFQAGTAYSHRKTGVAKVTPVSPRLNLLFYEKNRLITVQGCPTEGRVRKRKHFPK